MAKWNFIVSGNQLIKELVVTDNDTDPRSESFMQPSFDLQGGKIVFKESGQYKTAVYFSQIGTIGGETPTDIEDAYDKLIALVENFNGAGATAQYKFLLSQNGSDDPQTQSSGAVTKGVTYLINGSGGDFSNVGSPTSADGTYFIATATATPNDYGSASLDWNGGAPVVVSNFGTSLINSWFEYIGTGGYYFKKIGAFLEDDTFIQTPLSGYDAGATFGGGGAPLTIYRIDNDTILISASEDGNLTKSSILIETY